MPVSLTIGQLAVDMRLATDLVNFPPEYTQILTRALDTAKEHVEEYALNTTPQAVMDTAAARMAGYLIDAPQFTRMPALAFRNSGGMAILSPWHQPRSITV